MAGGVRHEDRNPTVNHRLLRTTPGAEQQAIPGRQCHGGPGEVHRFLQVSAFRIDLPVLELLCIPSGSLGRYEMNGSEATEIIRTSAGS